MNAPELQFHRDRKKVVFIVPTNNLVEQQSSVIERYTETVRVGKFQGTLILLNYANDRREE